MLGLGIRNALKREMRRVFGESPSEPAPTPLDDAEPPEPVDAATIPEPQPPDAPLPEAIEPVLPATSGGLSMEAVQEILDEMVRPALQADGGDISLVGVVGNDIHVRLVGACSSCPSSIMTMKLGVERLLQEEFPTMGQLIQVDS